jgi:hypothetical protein
MTLKSCSPIVGADVMSFDTEKEVLLAWKVRTVLFSRTLCFMGRYLFLYFNQ